VQIFDDQQQRPARSQGQQALFQRAEEPPLLLLRLELQEFGIVCMRVSRAGCYIGQPSSKLTRDVLFFGRESRDSVAREVCADEVEQGCVGADDVRLKTISLETQEAVCRGVCFSLGHQARLADPGLTGEQDCLPTFPADAVQHCM
jgi:hypothetical protein